MERSWSNMWSGPKAILPVLVLLLIMGCHDIVQEDISKKEIELISPADGYRTAQQAITFHWSEVEGASEYRIQISEPGFDNLQLLLLDSTVERTSFQHNLRPGRYEWRVRGENNVHETPYKTREVRIDSTNDISDLQILLDGPPDGLRTNATDITFTWHELVGAHYYNFRLEDAGGSLLFPEDTTHGTSYQVPDLPEGKLLWGVQGVNTSTGTQTSFSWDTLVVDTTDPAAPTLIAPQDNALRGDSSQTFEWDPPSDNGTPVHDSLFIYSDTTATSLVQEAAPPGSSYSDSLGIGTFFWRMRSYDEAGNRSPWSELRRIDVQ